MCLPATARATNANQAAIGGGTNPLACTDNGDGTFNCAPTSFAPFIPQAERRRLFLNGVPKFTYTGQFAGFRPARRM